MNMQLFILFVILTIVNVVLQTVKSLCTINAGKTTAALVNAITYGVYTVVIVYTMCELPLWLKALVTALCNFVGVFIVKLVEEKARKDKLWKIEATVKTDVATALVDEAKDYGLSYSYVPLSDGHTVFSFYSPTQACSTTVKQLLDCYNAKYFVSESKTL